MLYLLKRHPFAVKAHFGHCLVLTYAFPEEVLLPLIPPGLVLDRYEGYGFLAIALVETKDLRPSFAPSWMGQDFFLSGYRIFTRLGSAATSLRGLYILRSDASRRLMVYTGNLFTHYRYRICNTSCECFDDLLIWQIKTSAAEADLTVRASLHSRPALLPKGSPFPDLKIARRFAGPLPYTFDYEPQTRSIISIRGIRQAWQPEPIEVELEMPTYFNQKPFNNTQPILANAFYLKNVPYQWERGRRIPLESTPEEPITH